MLKFGKEPYLECSSRGEKRFSAFYARLKRYDGKCIEEIYQGSKVFEGGIKGLSWKEAKGKQPINVEEVRRLYAYLWDVYFDENPHLFELTEDYNGFSDIFGEKGHACQAEEIHRIVMERRLFNF